MGGVKLGGAYGAGLAGAAGGGAAGGGAAGRSGRRPGGVKVRVPNMDRSGSRSVGPSVSGSGAGVGSGRARGGNGAFSVRRPSTRPRWSASGRGLGRGTRGRSHRRGLVFRFVEIELRQDWRGGGRGRRGRVAVEGRPQEGRGREGAGRRRRCHRLRSGRRDGRRQRGRLGLLFFRLVGLFRRGVIIMGLRAIGGRAGGADEHGVEPGRNVAQFTQNEADRRERAPAHEADRAGGDEGIAERRHEDRDPERHDHKARQREQQTETNQEPPHRSTPRRTSPAGPVHALS